MANGPVGGRKVLVRGGTDLGKGVEEALAVHMEGHEEGGGDTKPDRPSPCRGRSTRHDWTVYFGRYIAYSIGINRRFHENCPTERRNDLIPR